MNRFMEKNCNLKVDKSAILYDKQKLINFNPQGVDMGCKYWKRDSVLGEYHCTAPAEETEQEYLEQRIDELLSANGSLQFKNDQLSAKCQRLDVAEKMAREARERMVAAEQRAEKAEVPIAEAKREADALAIWLWKTHYQEAAPNWELCDSVAGVITQIDNMVCQLIPRERVAEAVRECEKISKPRDKHVAMMIRKRYPQHFEGSDDTKQRGPIRPVIFHRRG